LLAQVPERLFAEWRVFHDLDPWGETRADLRNANLCALVESALSGKQVSLKRYMPFEEEPQKSDEQIEALVKDFFATMRK
jgi:hypothetical protein